MTDNPYAAPLAPTTVPLSKAEIAIRSVSRAFRFLGWTLFIIYLPITVATACMTIFAWWKWRQLTFTLSPREAMAPYVMSWVTLTCTGIVFLAWTYIRVGRGLLTQRPHVYRYAMFLSCLLVIFLLPLGVLCVWYLHKHWQTYCEECKASSVEVAANER